MPPPPDVRERHRGSLGGEAPGTSNKGGAPVDASPHDTAPPVHAHPRDEKFAAEGTSCHNFRVLQVLGTREGTV